MSQFRRNVAISCLICLVLLLLITGHQTQWPGLQRAKEAAALLASNSPTQSAPGQALVQLSPENNSTNQTDNGEVYRHQTAAHLSRTSVSKRECDSILASHLQQIIDNADKDSSIPFTMQFHNGQAVQQGTSHRVLDEFCLVFFIPQTPKPSGFRFEEAPIEGWGPDALHAEVASDDIRLIPEHPDYWGALVVSNNALSGKPGTMYAIYNIGYSLNHPGQYRVDAEIEWQHYDWVMEIPLKDGGVLEKEEELPNPILNITIEARSPNIQIDGVPVSRPTDTCYFGQAAVPDVRGRWYLASSFKEGGNQTTLNKDAHLEFAEHNNTVDEWGWTFAPDACNLLYFTPEDHASCLAGRTLQALADSNSRRLFKSLIAGGHAWCMDPEEQCQCRDQWEESLYDMYRENVSAFHFLENYRREEPTYFGNDTKLFFDFVGGALHGMFLNEWFRFFSERPMLPNTIQQNRTEHYGPMDLVHISMLGWDLAGIQTAAEVLARLPDLRQTLFSAYQPGTRFITRLAGANCCGNWNYKARFSGPRFAIFNAMWRSFWAEDEAAGLVKTYDPSVMQGRKDAEQANHCPTTHLRASHVRIEQMMWMTAVCEKDPRGYSIMRDWAHPPGSGAVQLDTEPNGGAGLA